MSLTKLIAMVVFLAIFVAHGLYVGACAASATSAWIDLDNSAPFGGTLGWTAYWHGQDYFEGFSYALAAAFAAWTLCRSTLFRRGRNVTAEGTVGGVTLLGVLMTGGCFLSGCCGSPMLAVYLSLFGAKALGLRKAAMALGTLASVSCGYWWISRVSRRGCGCQDKVLFSDGK